MNHNSRHITIAAFILPTIIVAIAPRLTNIPGPSTAAATPNQDAQGIAPAINRAKASLTETQSEAITHRRSLINAPTPNPFHYPIPQNSDPNPYDTPPANDPQQTTPQSTAPPTMLITTMASARGNGIAIINGTLRNEGDTIAEGWTITAINPANRTVTIQHTSGTTHTESQTR